MLRATDFEFRNRFWLIGLGYFLGFSAYRIDQTNFVQFLVAKFIGAGSPTAGYWVHALFALAAFIMFLGAALRTWAAAYLQSNVVHDESLHSEKLVAEGPYRHLRNPLYLGGILLAVGFGFLASRVGFFILVFGETFFFLRLIALEESRLSATQGEPFREFCRIVPKLWPSWSPRVPSSGMAPRWGQAVTGEIFLWGFVVGMAAFAVTLRQYVLWIIIAVALALYIFRGFTRFGKRKGVQAS
ncbi:MAG TPA: methyltransferase [Candidatus Acidoferrum sp.]|nr:methyltransferase [Candidatus Acidoferrum sp.]